MAVKMDTNGHELEFPASDPHIRRKPHPFEPYSPVIETMLLGLAAYRTGGKLEYSGGKVTNNAKGNDLLSKAYREGWPLIG